MKSIEIKRPQTVHKLNPIIEKRWSARAFSDTAISEDTLNHLLEAASWAASSMNEQPWHYIYAFRGTEGFKTLHDCLLKGNQPWAENAAVLMVCLAKKHFDRNGKVNRHAMHDTGAANTTMMLQAADLDIYGHMMGGFDPEKTIEALKIDTEKWEVACFIALGYLDSYETLEEPFREREIAPRSRKTVDTFSQQV